MFDTHCHLYFESLYKDLEEIILKSEEKGVKYFLVPGIDLKTNKKAIEISNVFENVYASLGIHPTVRIDENNIDSLTKKVEEQINHDKVQAVGEVGLDYYHRENPERIQKILLEKQLLIALKYDKSVILHNRHATEDILSVIEKLGFQNFSDGLVFHCAEPNDSILNASIKYNYYLGIDGDITFDLDKQNFIEKIPLENLVLETDSPFLAPSTKGIKEKDKINYPYFLPLIARKVAEIKKIDFNVLIEITLENSLKLFNI